jgi:predicted nucleic acid-binding protein
VIVVDTNVIAYLLLGGEKTHQARAVFQKDSAWVAPILWRSEFRNVLAYYLRQGKLVLADALQLMIEGELLFQGEEYQVDSGEVLSLVSSSRCSAYDCEFVALARHLNIPLVTSDGQLLAEFPETAVSLDAFISI